MNAMNHQGWLKANWFLLVAPLIVLFDLAAAKVIGWDARGGLEAALLFDFAIELPLLYVWCYWRLGKQVIVRAVALSCFSIWVVGHLVPTEQQLIMNSVGWLRYVGLVGLIVFEIKAVLFLWRTIFTGRETMDSAIDKMNEEGTPVWVSKLLAAEGMFWKRLWESIRKALGRNR